MRIIAPMMILIMMTSTLAGCTGGDPDAGGNDEIDMDILNQLIDDPAVRIRICLGKYNFHVIDLIQRIE